MLVDDWGSAFYHRIINGYSYGKVSPAKASANGQFSAQNLLSYGSSYRVMPEYDFFLPSIFDQRFKTQSNSYKEKNSAFYVRVVMYLLKYTHITIHMRFHLCKLSGDSKSQSVCKSLRCLVMSCSKAANFSALLSRGAHLELSASPFSWVRAAGMLVVE